MVVKTPVDLDGAIRECDDKFNLIRFEYICLLITITRESETLMFLLALTNSNRYSLWLYSYNNLICNCRNKETLNPTQSLLLCL
ncbi:hypothetical protein Syun_031712 [Stephania yunnanensis]|uniref:Uncharacterized protein n=1 Tax=Stephania yunnanensis TaxID=152371 RepID=A0AAP0DZV5_9MAGN